MPLKPNSLLLAMLTVVLSNLALLRLLGRDGLRTAFMRISRVSLGALRPRTWFRVVGELAGPLTRPVVRADPSLMLKYLGQYLGAELSESERAAILVSHYAFLKDRVEEGFFQKVVDGRIELWRHDAGGDHFRICLTYPHRYSSEGDLSLVFQSNHTDIYTLSFTIGPGSVAGLSEDHAIYIARLQGKGGGLELIRNATKGCLDVSPASLLLHATEAIATALEIRRIVGMSADMQVSASADSRPEGLVRGYDDFWIVSGGVKLSRNMYAIAVPLPEKPIASVKGNHRSRVLRKRAFKAAAKEQVRCEFCAVALVVGRDRR